MSTPCCDKVICAEAVTTDELEDAPASYQVVKGLALVGAWSVGHVASSSWVPVNVLGIEQERSQSMSALMASQMPEVL
jgi:hypothetical protein